MRRDFLACCCIVFGSFAAVNGIDPAPTNAPATSLTRFEYAEPHMGTTFRLVFYAPDKATADAAARRAFARVAQLNRILSDYLSDSELMKLCKTPNTWVPVSEDLYNVLDRARLLSEATDGAFDATIGPVVRLWRRARRTLEMPPADSLKKALSLVDYRNVEFDAKTRSIRLNVDGILLDLGGVAKGYAAAEALRIFRDLGLTRSLVAAGGDIVVGDAPPNAPGWRVALDAPLPGDPAILLLTNAAVSTSGDANQFVTIAGKRYSHIVDPKTGLGVTGRRAVTVVAIDGAFADGYASACCVLGHERGLRMIEANPRLAARFVDATEQPRVEASSRFDRFLTR